MGLFLPDVARLIHDEPGYNDLDYRCHIGVIVDHRSVHQKWTAISSYSKAVTKEIEHASVLQLVLHRSSVRKLHSGSRRAGDLHRPERVRHRDGYLYLNDMPGLGLDIDEQRAAQYPCRPRVDTWTEARTADGSLGRP